MPYNSINGRLPNESASKLGHLNILNSEWVRTLIEDFNYIDNENNGDVSNTQWVKLNSNEKILKNIWVVDGSFVKITSGNYQSKEVGFVKTALLMLDNKKIGKINKNTPHPLLMKDVLSDSALFHATVFPLRNIRTSKGSNYDAVRNIIFESIKIDEKGAYYETLKWLAYRKWTNGNMHSPEFNCPHCMGRIDGGLPYDEDRTNCPLCGKEVFLTDMLGFHLDMIEDSAGENVISAYMTIMETLMIFTPIRLLWNYNDKSIVTDTLFIKDGPLSLSGQYVKLVEPIREFLEYAKSQERTIHIIGSEKSGKFFEHLMQIQRFAPPYKKDDGIYYSVLNHQYILDEVQRRPKSGNQYGSRTNWGEKVYVKLEPDTSIVINVPTGLFNRNDDRPKKSDLIGIDRILKTLPSIVSRRYEGALFPIELANGIASMSSYPSSNILSQYTETNMNNKKY